MSVRKIPASQKTLTQISTHVAKLGKMDKTLLASIDTCKKMKQLFKRVEARASARIEPPPRCHAAGGKKEPCFIRGI